MRFDSSIQESLAELERAGLLRSHRRVSSAQGTEIVLDGHRVLCFCSNNYLGLAGHRDLLDATAAGLEDHGLGSGASRLISGSMDPHHEAEAKLASFVGFPDAVLFSSGYAANIGTIQALVGRGDAVFSDELNHASLIDGCRLSRASVHVYPHRDVDKLQTLLARHRPAARRALIVSDSVFSMDGTRAPVAELRRLADAHEAGLMLDEAHAVGVLGPSGRGVAAATRTKPDLVVGTLGKAFGVAGAFVAASRQTATLIRNRARSYVFSTAPPPALCIGAIAALRLVEAAEPARSRLRRHAQRLRTSLAELGFQAQPGDTQIIPVLIGDNRAAMELCGRLLREGVFVQGIRPPTVPDGTARLRLTPIATHDDAHIERAIHAFAQERA